MNKIIKIFFIILMMSNLSVFAQDTTIDIIEEQAIAKPRQQIGMYLFWFTQANPLKLLDNPNNTNSAISIINPCYEIEMGYTTPSFFNNWVRMGFKFWAWGSYKWNKIENGIENDGNPFQWMLFLNAYITPYIMLEFDTRGRLQVFLSYTDRNLSAGHVIKYELSTRFWLSGNGYNKKGEFRRGMWDYSTFDIHYFWTPIVSPRINKFTLYTRFRLRVLGSAYNPKVHPDNGEIFGEYNPNLNELLYTSIRIRFETWFTSYFSIQPLVEFGVNGIEKTSIKQPLFMNLGVLTRFQF